VNPTKLVRTNLLKNGQKCPFFLWLTISAEFATLQELYNIGDSMFKLSLIVIAIIAVVVAGPILMIWSLNTLFPVLAIPYTLNTWAAAVLLGGLFNARITTK
jgi:hypothetical protein